METRKKSQTQDHSYDAWIGRDAYDANGDKIGGIDAIYYDEYTDRPEWVAIRTGFFGTKVSFAPIAGSNQHGDDLQLAYDKGTIKDAPNCEADGHLNEEEERRLFEHYRVGWDDSMTSGYGEYGRADEGFDYSARDRDRAGNDDAMTRSEEELRVSKERTETGRARLRKYVVTDQEQVTVPIEREVVRVEHEPITEANVDKAMDGPDLTENEYEVVTHEERPVVSKETVPKERVRLKTETVTDEKTVTADVRKERIETEGDTQDDGKRR